MPLKLKIFSSKINKGAGIKKKIKNLFKKRYQTRKNYIEGLNSKNKKIKGGGSP